MKKLKDMERPSSSIHEDVRTTFEKHGMMTCKELDTECEIMCTNEDGADNYDVAGELINAYMSKHPAFGNTWQQLSVDARWVFIHDMHYGIESTVRQHMGMELRYTKPKFALIYSGSPVTSESIQNYEKSKQGCSYEDAMKVIK